MGKKTYYVYAPFSGHNWGQETYCYCCQGGRHTSAFPNPIDIGRSDGRSAGVWLYGSSGIRSAFIKSVDNVCASRRQPVTAGIEVSLYCQPDCQGFIGTVRYGHIKTPRAGLPGCFNLEDGLLYLGSILSRRDWQTCSGCNCGEGGAHTHMDTPDGAPNRFVCGAALLEGSTWIYKWKVDCAWQGAGADLDPCGEPDDN